MFNGTKARAKAMPTSSQRDGREACHNNLCFEISFQAHSTFISDNRKRIFFTIERLFATVDASLSLTRNEIIFT